MDPPRTWGYASTKYIPAYLVINPEFLQSFWIVFSFVLILTCLHIIRLHNIIKRLWNIPHIKLLNYKVKKVNLNVAEVRLFSFHLMVWLVLFHKVVKLLMKLGLFPGFILCALAASCVSFWEKASGNKRKEKNAKDGLAKRVAVLECHASYGHFQFEVLECYMTCKLYKPFWILYASKYILMKRKLSSGGGGEEVRKGWRLLVIQNCPGSDYLWYLRYCRHILVLLCFNL